MLSRREQAAYRMGFLHGQQVQITDRQGLDSDPIRILGCSDDQPASVTANDVNALARRTG